MIKKQVGNLFLYFILVFNFLRVFLVVTPELFIAALCFLIGKWTKQDTLWKYGRNKALAIDQWGNAELLGHPDETISSRLGRSYGHERYFWVRIFRRLVDYYAWKIFKDFDHCRRSVMVLEQESLKFQNYEIWSWNK